jgi:hypothetical protein
MTNFLPKMIYADIITSLNSVYKKLCVWLNDKGSFLIVLYATKSTLVKYILKTYSFEISKLNQT